ncbi:restriction endonuclease [bacterium]|nr:restriction endonuclease [bacterium]
MKKNENIQDRAKIEFTQKNLDFLSLSPDQFSEMCFQLVDNSEEYYDVEYYDGPGDKTRDIVAVETNRNGKDYKCYFQCKRYKRISFAHFKEEIDKLKKFCKKDQKFVPDKVIFCVASKISPTAKDQTKNYSKTLKFTQVYFWDSIKLDSRVNRFPSVKNKYFRPSFSSEILTSVDIGVQDILKVLSPQKGINTSLTIQIDEASRDIDLGDYKLAIGKLCLLERQLKEGDNREKLRILNNLGLCYNLPKFMGGNYEKAKEYFTKVLIISPDFIPTRINMALLLYNIGGSDNLNESYKILKKIWKEDKKRDDEIVLNSLLLVTIRSQGEEGALELYKTSRVKEIVNKSPILLSLLGEIYVGMNKIETALKFLNRIKKIEGEKFHFHYLAIKVYYQEYMLNSKFKFQIIPSHPDKRKLQEILNHIRAGLVLANNMNNPLLMNELKVLLISCLVMSMAYDSSEFLSTRESLNVNELNQVDQAQLEIIDFTNEIINSQFDSAYRVLRNSSNWDSISFNERLNISELFLFYGAPEISRKVLTDHRVIENDIDKIYYLLNMSIIEILLNNKNLAISCSNKAKELSQHVRDVDLRKKVMMHSNSINYRYSNDGETDRFINSAVEYNQEFPKDKMLTAIKIFNEEGEISNEIVKIVQKKNKEYQEMVKIFTTNNLPSYSLESWLKEPYSKIINNQRDLNLTLKYTVQTIEFQARIRDNFNGSENIIFDYSSLLNLNYMNLLGFLPELNKNFYIPRSLFNKIQRELLQYEDASLRKLWDYLRKSNEVVIIEPDNSLKCKIEQYDIFEDWMVDLVKYAKTPNCTVMTDDLPFLELIQTEEGVQSSNTRILLEILREKSIIDQKMYSLCIGKLAERFYIFLSFTGQDLFLITKEDGFSISLRFEHLVNQILLEGSMHKSFIEVFNSFLHKIWGLSINVEKKANYLSHIINLLMEYFMINYLNKNKVKLDGVGQYLSGIMVSIIKMSNLNEIYGIEEILNSKVAGYYRLKEIFRPVIEQRKKEISDKEKI